MIPIDIQVSRSMVKLKDIVSLPHLRQEHFALEASSLEGR